MGWHERGRGTPARSEKQCASKEVGTEPKPTVSHTDPPRRLDRHIPVLNRRTCRSDNHTGHNHNYCIQSQLLYIQSHNYCIIAPRTNPQSQAVCKMCKMDQPAQGVPSMHGSTKHVWGCADGQDDATTANGTQTKKESQSFYVIMSPWRSTLCMETLITIKPKSRTYTARPRGAGVRPRGGRWS